MPVHSFPGGSVTVSKRNVFLLVSRRQGIRIEASTTVSLIEASITLEGAAGTAQAQGSCSNCQRLNVMGPTFFGVLPGKAFQKVSYNLTIGTAAGTFQFSDTILFV